MKLDFTKIKTFLVENKKYVAIAAVFVALIIILVLAFSSKDKGETETAPEVPEATEEVINVDEVEPEVEPEVVATNDLLTDAYPEVNELINKYFEAMSNSDVDTLLQIVDNLSEDEQNQIVQKKEYIENYNNIVCYSKIGPVENSYIVFAYYEIKFINIDTLVPGLVPLYVCTSEDGSLYIYNGDLDPEVDSYISNVAADQDVIDLLDTVEKKYSEAQNSDEALKHFVARLAGEEIEEETTEEVAEENTEEQVEETAEATEETTEEQTEEVAEEQPAEETVYAKETINVRVAEDQESEKLGQIFAGESITRIAVLDSGWSKIKYDGKEAYVKSEYLSYDEIELEKLYLTSTVNIRAEASESADKVGTGFVGSKVTRLVKLDNGWSQISCDGVRGYVKSEFLSKTYN